MDLPRTSQRAYLPQVLLPFLPRVLSVSVRLPHLVSPQVAQGFSRIPGTMDPATDKW